MIRTISTFGLCAALLAAPAALAQSIDATLVGKVTDDTTGQAITGATVIVTSPSLQGSRQAKTDASGEFRISQLPIGTYSILFAKGGYKRVKYTEVRLRAGQTGRLNARIKPAPEKTQP